MMMNSKLRNQTILKKMLYAHLSMKMEAVPMQQTEIEIIYQEKKEFNNSIRF